MKTFIIVTVVEKKNSLKVSLQTEFNPSCSNLRLIQDRNTGLETVIKLAKAIAIRVYLNMEKA